MSASSEAQSPGFGTVRFALKVQDYNLEVSAQLPEGPVRPSVLLPVLQGLSNSLTELATVGAAQVNEKVSCCEGCGACCRQAVPITPVEARMLSEWIAEQPEERRAVLQERFRAAAAQLEAAGVAQAIRDTAGNAARGAMHALGLQYFALGIACPFLEDERCTIHEIRPLRCREYLVVSPAEHCSHPETKEIVGVKPPVLLSQILSKWDVNGDPHAHEIILLAMLDEWVSRHPPEQDHAHRTSPELLQEFLRAFAKDAASAPSDARETIGPVE
jgi:Fe-S-cluster containining protein